MSEAEFRRDDRELDRQQSHREELEREDIMSDFSPADPWLKELRLAARRA